MRSRKLSFWLLLVALTVSFAPALWAVEPVKININEATVEELSQLKGIGETLAERIVAYREESGPFKSIEDIMNVNGVGPKTFDEIKDMITLE
jgi:competence ComEA-like helix-hairpin-helix protein